MCIMFCKKIEINCICCDLPEFLTGSQAHVLLSCVRLLLFSYPNS